MCPGQCCGHILSRFNKQIRMGLFSFTQEVAMDLGTANTIVAEMEEGDISCTLHIFKKDNTTLGVTTYQYAYILEFKSDAELDKALEEIGSATLQGLLEGLVEDAQNSDYVNGNCILIPSVGDLVGGVLGIESEKIELFIKNKP